MRRVAQVRLCILDQNGAYEIFPCQFFAIRLSFRSSRGVSGRVLSGVYVCVCARNGAKIVLMNYFCSDFAAKLVIT